MCSDVLVKMSWISGITAAQSFLWAGDMVHIPFYNGSTNGLEHYLFLALFWVFWNVNEADICALRSLHFTADHGIPRNV